MKELYKNDALLGTIAVVLFIAGVVLSQWYIATMFILALTLSLISGLLGVVRKPKTKEGRNEDDSDSAA